MQANQHLFDQIFCDQVRQARRMTPEERVREGLRLSDLAMQVMADAVRHQFPHATDQELKQLLHERVLRIRQLGELR